MWPHVHLIPRRKGDTPHPRGGIRHVIPNKGNYQEHTPCPTVDDNTSRENWIHGVRKVFYTGRII